jgi:ribosomal protein S18 acetylase RimI-like enzyme
VHGKSRPDACPGGRRCILGAGAIVVFAVITAYPITLAQAADARAIAELSRDAIERGLSWRWTERRVLRSILEPTVNVAVARREGELLGFAVMQYGDEDAHISLFAVRAAERRTGLGSALLAWLEATATIAGMRSIRLEARAGNAPAKAFYRQHGFSESGTNPGYYEDVEDAVRMVKQLRPSALPTAMPPWRPTP